MDKLEFSVTYQEVTPESAEYGEASDTGFDHESLVFDTFEELVGYLDSNGFTQTSHWPAHSIGVHQWLHNESYITCYESLTYRSEAIHPQNERAARYLTLAWRYLV